MAETVKVEVNITAQDNTSGGVSSAQRKLTALEKVVDKAQKKLEKMGRTKCKVAIDVDESGAKKISEVDDALQKTNGKSAHVSVGADTDAIEEINSVGDAVDKLNGEVAVVTTEADGSAEGQLDDVGDKLAELNGEEAVVTTEAEDSAIDVLGSVSDAADELDGRTVTLDIQAVDNATDQINEITEKEYGGGGGGSGGNFGTAASAGVGAAAGSIAGAAAVMGASFGIYDSVTTFEEFEAGMSRVKAISGATGAEFDALTAKAKEMGATTKFTATDSAEAFNYMAMAGWKTDEMLEGISGIMDLAAASGESLGTTSDIVTDALTAFGMKASDSTHFADVMAQAAANANTDVGKMGESFKYVAPVAGAMGYTIEDTALALGLMANAGVKSSMAGTALRRAITSLANPTDKQAEAMEKYNVSLTKENGEIKTLNEVMGDLRTNLRGRADRSRIRHVRQSGYGRHACHCQC